MTWSESDFFPLNLFVSGRETPGPDEPPPYTILDSVTASASRPANSSNYLPKQGLDLQTIETKIKKKVCLQKI